MSARLRGVAPIFILLVAPLILFWPLVFGGRVLFWGTPLLQFYPWYRLAVEMISAGHAPLWNHTLGNGAPLAANLQSAVFYPLHLLYLVFPAERAMGYSVVLHVILAGLFMFAYGRTLGSGRFGATIAALSYMFSGFIIARTQFLSMVNAAAWLPLLFLLAERLVRRRRWGDATLLGTVLGVQFLAGHAQLWYYGLWALGAYVLWRGWQLSTLPSSQAVFLTKQAQQLLLVGLFVLALLVAGGLAAVQVVPTVELSRLSQRATGADWEFAMTYSFWPWRLITLFAPDFFGNPATGDYWGYGNYWEDAGYIGVLPILFALMAVFNLKSLSVGRRSPVTFFSLLALLALLLAMGKNTPVYPLVFRYVPGFGVFQAPARLLYLYTFGMATLAGIGADSFRPTERSLYVCRLSIAGGLSAFCAATAVQLFAPTVQITFIGATGRLALLIAVSALLLLVRDSPLHSPISLRWGSLWHAGAVCFVVADLITFGRPLTPTIEPALYHAPTVSGAFLRARAAGGPLRIYTPAQFQYDTMFYRYFSFKHFGPSDLTHWMGLRESLVPNQVVYEGLESTANYDPLLVRRLAEILEKVEKGRAEEALRLLRLMNVSYVAGGPPWPGLSAVFSDTVTLYQVSDPLPRAYVVPEARVVADPSALFAELSNPNFDPRREVLLETASPLPGSLSAGRLASQTAADNQQPTNVSLHYRPNGVTITTTTASAGYLVLADTFYPGWQATVDGQPTQVLCANYAFRAVALSSGQHQVDFDYNPLSFKAGYLVSLVTLGILVVAAVAGRIRWRSSHLFNLRREVESPLEDNGNYPDI
jgi:hypothetical protein